MTETWDKDFDDEPHVRGVLHRPNGAFDTAFVLVHGAGGAKGSPLLVALADEFARNGNGIGALRIDLPYRQKRPKGPPSPSGAAKDRRGIVRAIESLGVDRTFVGGTSYGGRQATMLAAEEPDLAAGLLIISYPLHPPGKPERLRTEHFPTLRTPALFVHGSRDGFGSLDEMKEHLPLLAGGHKLVEFASSGHGLVTSRSSQQDVESCAARIVTEFQAFVR